MAYQELKEIAWKMNREIVEAGLLTLTFGNASAMDRAAGVVAIKPSGVGYDGMTPDDMVILAIEDGHVVEGKLKPSSDTPTHLHLYRSFAGVNGVVHTHSTHATSWAQAGRELPCLGTTHADHFYGPVPVTRGLRPEEIREAYELNTGVVIVERFGTGGIDPLQVPAVLVSGHGPFAWGEQADKAVENAIALEVCAQMAIHTFTLNPSAKPLDQVLLDKHYLRKHGAKAYYGQK